MHAMRVFDMSINTFFFQICSQEHFALPFSPAVNNSEYIAFSLCYRDQPYLGVVVLAVSLVCGSRPSGLNAWRMPSMPPAQPGKFLEWHFWRSTKKVRTIKLAC